MKATLNPYIEITPNTRKGKPRVAGSRITVAEIVIMYLRMGQSLELIAGKYHLPLAAVYGAMAFYYENKAEIDLKIEEDEAFADSFRAANPSRLQEKLKAFRNE